MQITLHIVSVWNYETMYTEDRQHISPRENIASS